MFQSTTDEKQAELLALLAYENPFSEERARLERLILGEDFVHDTPQRTDPWQFGPGRENPQVHLLVQRATEILKRARPSLPSAHAAAEELYATLLRFVLFYEFEPRLRPLAIAALAPAPEPRERPLTSLRFPDFEDFRGTLEHFIPSQRQRLHMMGSPAHLFAIAFQLSRAFQSLYRTILGASTPSRNLRKSVWSSIFTSNRKRYERALFERMHETSTLILGPSGTGKELVASAIGSSRYLAFDPKRLVFGEEIAGSFLPLNISALPVHLVEAELFGHKKGSFSGAIQDRAGFLEACPKSGTLFLDEIGELSEEVQIKLLRTLQSRRFQRVGETTPRTFSGKLVSATNRDLGQAIESGKMRADFYYRICADVVETPALKEQLQDRPEDLNLLVESISQRLLPPSELGDFVAEAVKLLQEGGAHDCQWPGNVRQLEQCVRSILVRGTFPRLAGKPQRSGSSLRSGLLESGLNVNQLLELYAETMYEETRNYSEAARRLGIDRRTLKAHLTTWEQGRES